MPCVRLLLCLIAATAAAAPPVDTPELDAERDQLIERIAVGRDYDASVRRLRELVRQRDQLIATSNAAVAGKRAAEQAERDARTRRRAIRDEEKKALDHPLVGCVMSPDPAHPLPSRDRYKPRVDWGRVVRKEATRLLPKNALDDGTPATMYEIAGLAGHYFVHAEIMARQHPFIAEVGDLVVLCVERAGYDTSRPDDQFEVATGNAPLYPPAWQQPVQRGGYIVRVKRPPRIVDKTRWMPLQITRNDFFWMIKDVRLRFPPDANVLSNVEFDRDLGNGRWLMLSEDDDVTWILEVPRGLRGADKLAVGHSRWVIMSHAHFDTTLKKLVLVAEDLEDSYLE
jgi:hypothetical protein